MKDWKLYRLGSFLNRADRFEAKDDFKKYTFSGTYSYAKGIFRSYSKEGTEFNLAKIQRIKKNDFIFCKIMAWEGAFGVAPQECDGTVMSGAFVAYEIDQSVAKPKFLDYFFKIEKNWKNVGSGSTGTNVRRKTLFAEDFEKYEIFLPPLPEQQHIVSKIESVKQRIEEIKELRTEQEKEFQSLKFSIFSNAENSFSKINFASFLTPSDKFEEPEMGKNYRQVGVRWWGGGAYERETIDGSKTTYKSFVRLEENNFLFNKIWVRHGALAVVKHDTIGCYASGEFPVYNYDENEIHPRWLHFIVSLPTFWQRCSNLSQGTSGKNRIKPNEFLKMEIPLPPIKEQNRIVDLLDKLNAIKKNYTQIQKELNELLPSLLDKAFKSEL